MSPFPSFATISPAGNSTGHGSAGPSEYPATERGPAQEHEGAFVRLELVAEIGEPMDHGASSRILFLGTMWKWILRAGTVPAVAILQRPGFLLPLLSLNSWPNTMAL